MIVVWFILLFIWAFILIVDGDVSILLWFLLLFLWIGLLSHYIKTYRNWKRFINIRKQERQENLDVDRALLKQNLEGEYVPREEG